MLAYIEYIVELTIMRLVSV